NPQSRLHSENISLDFGILVQAGVKGENFRQNGFDIRFEVGDVSFDVPVIGMHNMENVLAVVAVTRLLNIPDSQVAKAMQTYRGIYRRTQRVGEQKGIVVVDDFAHNPAEVVAAIKSCQGVGKRVLAWFQPHGYGPLRFMHKELSASLSEALRQQDVFLISDVYYAGGTVDKNIRSDIVAEEINRNHKSSVYLPSKDQIHQYLINHSKTGDVILLMGARDPDLGTFARRILDGL
ncbi:MAG: glutamate ligase domain-containing protein, partial [Bacteroidota bacterium]